MKYIGERATCNYTWFWCCFQGRTLFSQHHDALCTGFICTIHREPQRPKGASSPDFISRTHLQALSRVTSTALLAVAAGATESGNIWHQNPLNLTQSGSGDKKRKPFFFCPFFSLKLSPCWTLCAAMWLRYEDYQQTGLQCMRNKTKWWRSHP